MLHGVNPFTTSSYRVLRKVFLSAILTLPLGFALLFVLYGSPDVYYHPSKQSFQHGHVRDTIPPQHQSLGKAESKNYTIHIWVHGERMKRRFLRSYGRSTRDPYKFCSVSNCRLTTDSAKVDLADAVFFHLHQMKGPYELPEYHPRNQMWIFFTDESPYHTFIATRRYTMKDYNGLFNWSMTYRKDSDIPVPYGRTVSLKSSSEVPQNIPNYAKLKNRTVAILGSNCGGRNFRWDYVKELKHYIDVDIYGHCGSLKCPGHFTRDCSSLNKYKFYLAFENSNCKEYITEKMWWNAYEKEAIPVVMGSRKIDYESLCPPHSFIHVDDFDSPSELAKYLNFLNKNDTAYNQYFQWKYKYKVVNEHGYFGSLSLHLCRICEKLNAKPIEPKIYTDLEKFWNSKSDCFRPSWLPKKKLS